MSKHQPLPSAAALASLIEARDVMAVLTARDAVYEPIFARMEAEVTKLEAELNSDPVVMARRAMAARLAAADDPGAAA